MQRRPQRIEPSDLARLHTTLDTIAAVSLGGTRLRALVLLAHAAALDLGDVITLDLRSAVTLAANARRWTVRAPCYLSYVRSRRDAPAPPVLPAAAAPYVETWIRAAAHEHHLSWPPPVGIPLFHGFERGRCVRLSPRTIQAQFAALQRTSCTAAHYRFSDLRHDAITRFAERRPLPMVAQFARISERSALAYFPDSATATLAELAAKD